MTFEDKFRDAGTNGKEFRGAPFWSWNDDLDPEELRWQVRTMCESGMGGFFMHARIGLTTPYLSKEYMDCHQACIDEAKKLGMGAWLYDEDCWPSGSAGGITPAKGEFYQAKWLMPAGYGSNPEGKTLASFSLTKDGDAVKDYSRVSEGADEGDIVKFQIAQFGYIDILNKQAVAQFIDTTHEAFKKVFSSEFGKSIPGMFTDEPNYHHTNWSQNFCSVPWTDDLPREFRLRRGYDITDRIPELFYETGNYMKTRYDFWRTVTEMYVEAFTKQIGEWCGREGISLTGHYLLEDTLKFQIFSIGAAMPHYEYQQLPGIDHLCRRIADPLLCKQVSSVAHQFGGRRVLSEMFGCSGWNMSFEDQKWIAEWQYVLGVNLMCQHLALYSLKGCRKRDYPPSIFYQQPWWPEYRTVENHFARLARALTSGEIVADVLLIHPMESAWAVYSPFRCGWNPERDKGDELNDEFVKLSQYLQQMHIDYEYADEGILERHGKIQNGKIVVKDASYSLVIVPPCLTLRASTVDLLGQWITDGGKVIVAGEMPGMIDGEESDEPGWLLGEQTVVPNEYEEVKAAVHSIVKPRIQILDQYGADIADIYYQQRNLGSKQLFFMVNINNQDAAYEQALIRIPGYGMVEEWDLDTGEIRPLPSEHIKDAMVVELRFEPTQSHLIAFNPDAEPLLKAPERWMAVDEQEINGIWKAVRPDPNLLTMDYCSYKVGDGEWSDPTPAIWLKGKLSQIENPTPVALRYTFRTNFSEQKGRGMTLLVERPWDYEITVNGTKINYVNEGWYVDNSFKKINIDGLVKAGENVVEMKCTYLGDAGRQKRQRELNIEGDLARMWTNPPADVEKPITIPYDGATALKIKLFNEFKYGLEIESIYLYGDFNVYSDNEGFVLRDTKSEVPTGDLVPEGYTFYRGRLILSQDFSFDKRNADKVVLRFDDMGAIIAKVKLNNNFVGAVVWRPLELDVTGFVKDGQNSIEIELTNSCRNMLGPHHHKAGELYTVSPDSFLAAAGYVGVADSPGAQGALDAWTDDYSFVPFGFTSAPKLVRMNKA